MINDMLSSVSSIYIAYGATDFRKQISSLCAIIENNFKLNPYNKTAFIFCNKRRTSIKVLCYDKNGFVLAQKTLLDKDNMKFQWPRNEEQLESITKEQLQWLLSGLKLHQKGSFKDIQIDKNYMLN